MKKVKIQGKCPKCDSKSLYYGKIVGMGSSGNYFLCEDCGEDLSYSIINHRRIKVKEKNEKRY